LANHGYQCKEEILLLRLSPSPPSKGGDGLINLL
jgi:hypothetical protein